MLQQIVDGGGAVRDCLILNERDLGALLEVVTSTSCGLGVGAACASVVTIASIITPLAPVIALRPICAFGSIRTDAPAHTSTLTRRSGQRCLDFRALQLLGLPEVHLPSSLVKFLDNLQPLFNFLLLALLFMLFVALFRKTLERQGILREYIDLVIVIVKFFTRHLLSQLGSLSELTDGADVPSVRIRDVVRLLVEAIFNI